MKYGFVTIERHNELRQQGVHLHVFYQGQDVTSRCVFADDSQDVAELFCVNVDGKKYLDATGHVAKERVTGIEMREGEPF